MFRGLDASMQSLRSVIRHYGYGSLRQDSARIHACVDIVDRTSSDLLMRIQSLSPSRKPTEFR